jgi:hypothetical protein
MAFAESNRRSGQVNHRLPLAAGESGRHGEVRFADEFSNRRESVAKMIDRLGAKPGKLAFLYEAGPSVYGLHRQTTMMGRDWVVVAPSLAPTRPGDLPTISLNKPA